MRERVSLEECQVGLIRGESEESEGGSNENSCVRVCLGDGAWFQAEGAANAMACVKLSLASSRPNLLCCCRGVSKGEKST